MTSKPSGDKLKQWLSNYRGDTGIRQDPLPLSVNEVRDEADTGRMLLMSGHLLSWLTETPELATHASRDTLETSVELKTLLLERYGLSDLKILSSEDQTSLLHAVGNTFAGWFDVLKSKGTGNEAALTAAAALRCSDMAGDDNALATGLRSFMPSTNAECNAPEHIDRLTVDAGKAQTPKELALISARVLNAGAGMKEHTSGRNVCDKARLIAGQLSISAPNADLMRRTSDALLEMSFLFRTHDGNQMLALCKDLSQRTGRTIQLLHGAKQTPSAPRA